LSSVISGNPMWRLAPFRTTLDRRNGSNQHK
jgi:hypothetical protein